MKLSKPFTMGLCAISLLVFVTVVYQHSKNNVSWGGGTYESTAPIVQSSSSSVAIVLEDDPNLVPAEDLLQETYVAGVCDSEIPSDWHVRSSDDQAVWNREGNVEPPIELSAEDFFDRFTDNGLLVFNPPFKPALYSLAAADTRLLGHSDDPGAEDSNRLELDILSLPRGEMEKLFSLLEKAPDDYSWKTIEVDGQSLKVLRNVYPDGKVSGQELIFVPAELINAQNGLIIFNRSNYWVDPQNVAFRNGVAHFLSTLDFGSCPQDWSS